MEHIPHKLLFVRRVGFVFCGILLTLAPLIWSMIHKAPPHVIADEPRSPTPLNGDYEVLYTAEGFVPSKLEIPIGSRVAFKNISETLLWTASDPYPTHTDYPQFDAKRAFATGETYIFPFQKTGTFGYHNDERSTDRGLIRVVDPLNALPNIDKTKSRQQAERNKLLAMFDANDPSSLFTIIDAIQADESLSLNCHDIGHDLGHRAYELFGFSGAMAFNDPVQSQHAPVQDICAGGYMHGILEELSLHQSEFKDQPGSMCASVPDADRASCDHGVGHALMFANGRDIQASLSGCRSLAQHTDAYRCFEGVWMETFWGSTEHTGTSSLGWDLQNPLDICLAAQKDARPDCFLYSSFGYLRTHTKDYAGAVQLCTKSGLTETDAAYCLKGVGITMLSYLKGQHLERSETFVTGLPDAEKYAFYQGVIGYADFSQMKRVELERTCALLETDAPLCTAVLSSSTKVTKP